MTLIATIKRILLYHADLLSTAEVPIYFFSSSFLFQFHNYSLVNTIKSVVYFLQNETNIHIPYTQSLIFEIWFFHTVYGTTDLYTQQFTRIYWRDLVVARRKFWFLPYAFLLKINTQYITPVYCLDFITEKCERRT